MANSCSFLTKKPSPLSDRAARYARISGVAPENCVTVPGNDIRVVLSVVEHVKRLLKEHAHVALAALAHPARFRERTSRNCELSKKWKAKETRHCNATVKDHATANPDGVTAKRNTLVFAQTKRVQTERCDSIFGAVSGALAQHCNT